MIATRGVAALAAALPLLLACSLAPVDLEETRPLPLRSTIVAADGTLLARLYEQNRVYVSIDDIPRELIDAVIAVEDARFFRHSGFDFRSIARAAVANLRSGEIVQGGSTITQQYVKNTYFRAPGQTLARKARELRLAIEVERRYSKEQILERYLNTVYLGGGAYGVKVAAYTYFRHGLDELTLSEAALLAALIRSPSLYDPRVEPERARERRNFVLERMVSLDKLSALRAGRAKVAPLGVAPARRPRATREPFFVEAVRQEIIGDRRLGPTPDDRDSRLNQGGLRVTTTLSPRLQEAAEEAVASVLNQPGDPEAAVIAMRPRSGAIVAMVGGRDWAASQVNLALGVRGGGSGRQPGSSFKPVVAAAAMEAGITLDESYDSSPAIFPLEGGGSWAVRNAEGVGYGLMPLDEALVHSVNGVYARLGLQLGPGLITRQAHLMGVRSALSVVPSVALGSDEVSVLDMAAVYSTLANRGTAVTPTTIKEIRLPTGELLEPAQRTTENVVSPGNAFLLTKVLEQVVERGTGTAADIGRPAAGKTGTTNDYADAWFVGYTPELVAAVWVGYPEGRIAMTSVHGIRVSGGSFPAMIWRAFMSEALEGVPIRDFWVPEGQYVTVEIDPETGLRAAPWCPGEPRVMLREVVPTEYCPPPPSPTPEPTASPKPRETPDDGGRGDENQPDDEPDKGGGGPDQEPQPTPSPSPSGEEPPSG